MGDKERQGGFLLICFGFLLILLIPFTYIEPLFSSPYVATVTRGMVITTVIPLSIFLISIGLCLLISNKIREG